nr:hypothetical protein [Akkermansiaceae bacterium]
IAPQCSRGGIGWSGPIAQAVISLIDDILREVAGADPKRVYLTGYSLGAYGTYNLLAMKPDLFAAAIPAAGGGNTAIAPRLRGIDIWIYHGVHDVSVPVKAAREMAAALKNAGVSVQYTEMPFDHSIPGKVFFQEKVHKWLFQQKRE